jgi:hypothetical protein
MTEQSVDVDGGVHGLEDTIVSFKLQRHHGTGDGDGAVDSCLSACEGPPGQVVHRPEHNAEAFPVRLRQESKRRVHAP